MSELRITTEFESGHSTVAEHRASWSRLEIWIGDECVTQFQDLTQQELRYGILRPLYPIAEWLLTNWWSVFFESHHPQRYGYWRRHCLRTAEEGFALPDLEFRCFGELTELIWNRRRSAHQMAEFVSEGRILLPRNEVQTELFRFLECVCHRLEKRGVADNFVMQEWRILQNLKTDEQSFCRVAGALGLDPFDTDEDSAGKIEAATQQLPFELHEEIFS
ncbi:MAG TPA: hypothetical protein VM165_13885, partial [Planctomycetaceae bacterium]|nr:hypothetical protein [Planctomycetaceae bacterium]